MCLFGFESDCVASSFSSLPTLLVSHFFQQHFFHTAEGWLMWFDLKTLDKVKITKAKRDGGA